MDKTPWVSLRVSKDTLTREKKKAREMLALYVGESGGRRGLVTFLIFLFMHVYRGMLASIQSR